MIYLAVKHEKQPDKLFWFACPDSLVPHVRPGSAVLCATRYGEQPGLVAAVLRCDSAALMRQIAALPDQTPLRFVTAVQTDMPLSDLWISGAFRQTQPSPGKLRNRELEYAISGAFDTRVAFDENGMLLDGYTAYLTAQKLGHSTLTGYLRAIL